MPVPSAQSFAPLPLASSLQLLDWAFIILSLGIVISIGAFARRYMKSVADFMSGSRLAGRYLLAVASTEMGAGAVVFVAMFERVAVSGFSLTWWGWLSAPVMLIFTIMGWVTYRFRETRCLTLAQFFEVRYSRSFRIFNGGLAFLAGIANFGIIPAVGARCMVFFFGLPQTISVGGFHIETFILLMALFLTITLFITLAGGFITVMVTDCVEGILSQIFYLVIIATLLLLFSWQDISSTLAVAEPGKSRLNPFDSFGLSDFNLWYVLMGLAVTVYGRMAWQNAGSYNTAAITPHEGRMAGVLGAWREMGKTSVVVLLAVCAVTFLNDPKYTAAAAPAHEVISQLESPQIQKQMTVPAALSEFLPAGVKGMLIAILLMGVFGGDSTHLHSWGSIFVQDVVMPLRRKPFSPKNHILALRLGIIGVALFSFVFGSLFRQTEYIFMWWAVTTAIYVGGAGSAIIGGLYWKKGTTAGAWAGLITGSILSVTGIILRTTSNGQFPLNGIQISFCAMLAAIIVYVTVSLLTHRKDFNLEKMLHRGRYAIAQPEVEEAALLSVPQKRSFWLKVIGIDDEYSPKDKLIAGALFGWSMSWSIVFLVGTVWNIIIPWPLAWWSGFWHIAGIGIPIFITLVTSVWFTWGGLHDIRALFHRLQHHKSASSDDGFVVGHQNLDEIHGHSGEVTAAKRELQLKR
ncbi:sodium:proline symporter [Spartobacteria bacterium LR76]|nr:sodium:proline symporter [Spartobacteria bacterium LR76]